MKASRTRPIQLPGRRIDGVSDSGVGFEKKFDTSAYNWRGTPVLSADAAAVPVCWNIELARLTWADFYDSVDEYVDDDEVLVDPRPRWGTRGSLVSPPRAIVFAHQPGSLTTAVYEAVKALRPRLREAGVFAGTVRTDLANSSYSVVKWSLLHRDYVKITEADTQEYTMLDVDEAHSVGGEVLFLVEENTVSATSTTPYFRQSGAVPLSLLAAHDLDLLGRTQLSFARVKYVFVQGFSNLITAAAVTQMNNFKGQAPPDMVKYMQFAGGIFNPGQFSPDSTAEAKLAVQREITDFFRI